MVPTINVSDEGISGLGSFGFTCDLVEVQSKVKSQEQIAESNRNNWIVVPREFSGWKYELIVDPARLAYSPALEKAAKELEISNYQNTSKDSLRRDFVDYNNHPESLKLNLALGNITPTLEESTTFGRLLLLGARGEEKVRYASGKPLDESECEALFGDIYQAKSLWRGEWLDADFKYKDSKFYLHQNYTLNKQGNLSPRSKISLAKNTLMQNRAPGFSLENWLKNPTKQGMPTDKTQNGNSYYWVPLRNNNSVARFSAHSGRFYMLCGACPSCRYSGLGVRAAKRLN